MTELNESLKGKVPECINLLKGGNWIKARVLSRQLNVTERDLRSLVRYIRLNVTWQITSGDNGYHWVTDPVEAINQMKRIKAHSLSQLELVDAAERMILEERGSYNAVRKAI